MRKEKVCVIGLGYVGLTLAVYLAGHGKKVYGLEINEKILGSLGSKKAHFYEEGFDEELKRVVENGSFAFGKKYPEDLGEELSKTTFIITVGTPLGPEDNLNFHFLESVAKALSLVIKKGDCVILRSTVTIGTTCHFFKPFLDKTCDDYSLGFCPERTLEGKAFEELFSLPQIISGIDGRSLKEISNFFKPVCKEIIPMDSTEEAEMVKLLNNSERDLSFALSNEIALMCEAKNLDAYNIIKAANHHYPRSNIKKPGPVGGPCLEKDPHILTKSFDQSASDKHYSPYLFKASRLINESLIVKALDNFFQKHTFFQSNHKDLKVAILGFAFKGYPATGDMRGSLVYSIIDYIQKQFPQACLVGHDYITPTEIMKKAGVLEGFHNVHEGVSKAHLVILHNNHPCYSKEDWMNLQSLMDENGYIYDFWNQLDRRAFSKNNYYVFGGKN